MRTRARTDKGHKAIVQALRNCERCGATFHPIRKKRFCSPQCFAATRKGVPARVQRPRPTTTCAKCGGQRDFYAKVCRVCLGHGSTAKACLACGKEFSVRNSHAPNRTHCSAACMAVTYRTEMVGAKNPNSNARHGGRTSRAGGRFRIRKDDNHDVVVEAFQKAGCAVWDTHAVGRGFPDIVVRCNGIRLVEIKNRNNDYGKKGLSESQKQFFAEWEGCAWLCHGPEEAIELVRQWRTA